MALPKLHFPTRAAWRRWLNSNHNKVSDGLWLVFYKQATGKPTVSHADALDEALCYGWIDSLVRKLDEQRYAIKFTPRKPGSKWSEVNKQKVARLIDTGLMTRHGLALIEAAKASGSWEQKIVKPVVSLEIPAAFAAALKANRKAAAHFEQLAPSHKRRYIGWINLTKREETRKKRIAEALSLLAQKKQLGLK